jgi:hypothetical protein
MDYTGYVTIKDNTFSKNSYGILEYPISFSSGSCLIENNKFSENDVGLSCFRQVNTVKINTVKNNRFTNNKKAIIIRGGESDIIGNILEMNDNGIEFVPYKSLNGISTAQGKIYNNYFNNNVNVTGDLTISKYIWSIDKTKGKNIIGGNYLGGNYWGKPDNSGFSQITKDKNKDGFCDSAYQIDGANIDLLPLAGKNTIIKNK